MSISRRDEERALTRDEREIVTKTHHPALQELDDKELSSVIKLLRERRDKASGEVQRRKREMRGKAAPKGNEAATSASGNKLKLEVLATAMRRLNAERTRREEMGSQIELARRALTLKQASDAKDAPKNTRHARKGMRKAASERRQNLVRPMETGRQRKAGAVAQAKRDSR
ncbi:hypothetical protein GTW25_09795 [Aliihoeflea aestuarii]|jgi:hypothetical protein|uniref:hypothetical protein n=1 Tax=Aliihoeflea aestuarii TaxID=453840 RepID=UPI00209387A2|nr:hypothetical protein [Aliihoeflea aestuarii]MCO6391319.1 hypothetical protein [Aliihoeflea aestuarii]